MSYIHSFSIFVDVKFREQSKGGFMYPIVHMADFTFGLS